MSKKRTVNGRKAFKLSLWNWAVIFFKGTFGDGLASAFEYILNLLNDKLLSKVPAEDLKKYSGIIVALSEFGEKVLGYYQVDENKKNALTKTIAALQNRASALEDGKVTQEEFEQAIKDVVETVNAWKSIGSIKKK